MRTDPSDLSRHTCTWGACVKRDPNSDTRILKMYKPLRHTNSWPPRCKAWTEAGILLDIRFLRQTVSKNPRFMSQPDYVLTKVHCKAKQCDRRMTNRRRTRHAHVVREVRMTLPKSETVQRRNIGKPPTRWSGRLQRSECVVSLCSKACALG